MEPNTYTFYQLCNRLAEIENFPFANYKSLPKSHPMKIAYEGNFENYRNTKLKQFRRFRADRGFPKFSSHSIDGVLHFDEQRAIEIMFILANFNEPFIKKIKKLKDISLAERHEINVLFKKFVTDNFSDRLNQTETEDILNIFEHVIMLDLYELYYRLRETYSSYLDEINEFLTWIEPTLSKESRDKIKFERKVFAETTTQKVFDEVSIALSHNENSNIINCTRQSCPLLNDNDKITILYAFESTLEDEINLLGNENIHDVIVKVSEEFKQIVSLFSELRYIEIDDISDYSFDYNSSEMEYKEYLFSHISTANDLLEKTTEEIKNSKKDRRYQRIIEEIQNL